MELGDPWGPFQLKLFYDSMKNMNIFIRRNISVFLQILTHQCLPSVKRRVGNFSFKKRDSEKVGKLLKNKQSRDKMFPGILVWLKLHTRGLL